MKYLTITLCLVLLLTATVFVEEAECGLLLAKAVKAKKVKKLLALKKVG